MDIGLKVVPWSFTQCKAGADGGNVCAGHEQLEAAVSCAMPKAIGSAGRASASQQELECVASAGVGAAPPWQWSVHAHANCGR